MKYGKYEVSPETMCMDHLRDQDKHMTILDTGSWRYQRPTIPALAPPCEKACGAGINIRQVHGLLAQGKKKRAWQAVVNTNPLPSITGRICSNPCEAACLRGKFDEALNIRGLELFLGDWGLDLFFAAGPRSQKNRKIAIIGSGPASLTSAFYLANRGYRTNILEPLPQAGSNRYYGSHYPKVEEVIEKQIAFILRSGATLEVDTGDLSSKELLHQGFSAVFLGMDKNWVVDTPGMVPVDPATFATSISGIFAAPDVISPTHPIDKLIGNGRLAATAIDHYLNKVDSAERTAPPTKAVSFQDLNLSYFKKEARLIPNNQKTAKNEARRCFRCGECDACGVCWYVCPDGVTEKKQGRFEADLKWCKGCGLCAFECPRGAIVMEDENR